MNDYLLYEKAYIPDSNFPIRIGKTSINHSNEIFKRHWHEQIELLYFVEGEAEIECNDVSMITKPEELIVVNSNQIHYCRGLGKPVTFYCIIIDISFLKSGFHDICEAKYIMPIANNHIFFKNRINGDKEIINCINKIIKEYEQKEQGFELAIKSYVYGLMVLLLRKYADKVISLKEYNEHNNILERLNKVLVYIEKNYSQSIRMEQMADLINVSAYHFCHLFKRATGKTLTEYVNSVRIEQADIALRNTDMSITEIALANGFNDVSYFSRVFKKYKKKSPSEIRKIN